MISDRAIQLIAEAKIEQAIDDGKFERLTGFGKPFEFDLTQHDPNWWIKNKCKMEEMKIKLNQRNPNV